MNEDRFNKYRENEADGGYEPSFEWFQRDPEESRFFVLSDDIFETNIGFDIEESEMFTR
jgi:hypothetical protein